MDEKICIDVQNGLYIDWKRKEIVGSDNNIEDANYYTNYTAYQNKATTYNNIEGITATFNSTLNGYTVIFAIDLQKSNLSTVEEKYYYGFKEVPKVVKFEMQTYGFNCN